MPPYEIALFYRNLKKWLFQKKSDFDGKNQVKVKKMMKPKMVRTVHRNILYRMDLEIWREKSGIWRKRKKGCFQKWGLKKWKKVKVWDSKWGLLGRFQMEKYSKIYSGPNPHHPGSIFIYKIIILKKNHRKSTKIKKNQ